MNKSCATPFGEWVNPKGYTTTKDHNETYLLFWSISVYQVHIPAVDPITFRETNGAELRITDLLSDDGSIPPFIWGVPGLSSNRFEYAYLFHDFMCKYGGLFVQGPSEETFHFRRMTRLDADKLLVRMVGADGGNWAARKAIYRGVRIGSTWVRFPSIDYWDAHHMPVTGRLNPLGTPGILTP
jgi:hypothetical protein